MIRVFLLGCVSLLALSACGTLDKINSDKKLVYKSNTTTKPLSFPPDLTTDKVESLYTVPNTLSGYNQAQQQGPASNTHILPQHQDVRMVRAGNQRWLITKNSPQALWPKLKQFWQGLGIAVKREHPQAGIMETAWAENRAELETGFIRGFLSKVAGFIYSTGTQDKFIVRLERTPDKQTEIFLSHQRMEEVLNGETTIWKPAKARPELEAEILSRLMAHLGGNKQSTAEAKKAVQSYDRATLNINASGVATVTVADDFPNAWRRTGNALERSGFSVEDLNRSAGVYYIHYVDPEYSRKKGFFSKVFRKHTPNQVKYIVKVANTGPARSQLSILNRKQQLLNDQSSQRIAKILYEQLR